ncbi:MAG: hypothetical protein HQK60_08955 [Deltaproteobacteria bacterium]|nr:hypothetical protein [Deltaproteobacteria bacterium]
MNRFLTALGLMILGCLFQPGGPGWSATEKSHELAIVTKISGVAYYSNPAEGVNLAPLKPGTKIWSGDVLTLNQGTKLKLHYLDTKGRCETWWGAVSFNVLDNGGVAIGQSRDAIKPQVTYAPIQTGPVIRHSLLPFFRSRPGKSELRTAPPQGIHPSALLSPLTEQDEHDIAQAEEFYRQEKITADPDDIIPEVYLLSVYAGHHQYTRMENLILGLLAAPKPAGAILQYWHTWVLEQAKTFSVPPRK